MDIGPNTSTAQLIQHILSRYHEAHRAELPPLIALSEKVERVHLNDSNAPQGLNAFLRRMQGELEVHMKKEELILFPNMLRGTNPHLLAPITQMRLDHDDHAESLARLSALTNAFTPPEGACRSWQALYVGAKKLHDDLTRHIKIENEILFARFEKEISAISASGLR